MGQAKVKCMLFEANCIYLILVNLAVIEFDTSNAALKCYVVGLSRSSRLEGNDPLSI